MNNQKIFDKVVTHLLTQGRRSVSWNGNCQYRGPEGRKCAIGCLIPDQYYHKSLDDNGTLAYQLKEFFPSKIYDRLFGDVETSLLSNVQYAHDHPSNWGPKGFKRLDILKKIAMDYDLKWNF